MVSSPGFFPVRSFALARGFSRSPEPRRCVCAARNEFRIDSLVNGLPQHVLVSAISFVARDGEAPAIPLADRSSTKSIAVEIGRSTGERIMSTSNGRETTRDLAWQSQKPQRRQSQELRRRQSQESRRWQTQDPLRSGSFPGQGTNAHERGPSQGPRRLAPAVSEAQQLTGHEGATSNRRRRRREPERRLCTPPVEVPPTSPSRANVSAPKFCTLRRRCSPHLRTPCWLVAPTTITPLPSPSVRLPNAASRARRSSRSPKLAGLLRLPIWVPPT
jgi:hypothetical protein